MPFGLNLVSPQGSSTSVACEVPWSAMAWSKALLSAGCSAALHFEGSTAATRAAGACDAAVNPCPASRFRKGARSTSESFASDIQLMTPCDPRRNKTLLANERISTRSPWFSCPLPCLCPAHRRRLVGAYPDPADPDASHPDAPDALGWVHLRRGSQGPVLLLGACVFPSMHGCLVSNGLGFWRKHWQSLRRV